MAALGAGLKGLHSKSFNPAPPCKKRPGSARGRRPLQDADALGSNAGGSENFQTIDYSLHNQGVHHSAKYDTFGTPRPLPGRQNHKEEETSPPSPRKEEEDPLSGLASEKVMFDRSFLTAMQDKILVAIRQEVREEGTRVRGFVKKAVQELKSEILTDVTALQQSFSRASNKVVEEVSAALEDTKADVANRFAQTIARVSDTDMRVEASSSRLCQVMHESESKTQATNADMLKALDALKTRIDGAGASNTHTVLAAVKEGHIGIETGIRASLAQAASLNAGQADMMTEVKQLRDGRLEVDLSDFSQTVLQVIKEQSPEAALSDVTITLNELKAEISKLPALQTSVAELRQVADVCTGTYITSGVADLCGAMEAFRQERERLLTNVEQFRDSQSFQTIHGDIKQLAQFGAERELRRGQFEQELRESIRSVHELRTFGSTNLQILVEGVEQTQQRVSNVADQLLSKLDGQHVEAAGILEKLVNTLEVRDQRFLDILTAIDPDAKKAQGIEKRHWEC